MIRTSNYSEAGRFSPPNKPHELIAPDAVAYIQTETKPMTSHSRTLPVGLANNGTYALL